MIVTIHGSKRRLNSHWGPVFDCDYVDIITDESLHESMIVTQTEDYRLEVNYTNKAEDKL